MTDYFTIIGILFSALLILKLPVIYLLGEKWNQFELGLAYKVQKPSWIKYIFAFDIAIISFTWIQFYLNQNLKNFIISVFLTLTLIKVSTLMFNYRNFRNFAEKITIVNKKKLLLINFATFLMGIFLLYVVFFL